MDANTTDRSVTGIIAAFRASLHEFKNYREHKRKARKSNEQKNQKRSKDSADLSGDELLLSNSLRRGAVDVQREYDRNYRNHGDQYAVGDATTHSSLGRTLRKLNTCFQNIIAALLRKDAKIDYRYLTSVSDISRQEALDTLSQLSVRMSASAYSLQQQKEAAKHKKHKQNDPRARAKKLGSSKSASDISDRSKSSRVGNAGQPVVKMVQLKSSSSPQLAMVRPKPRRSGAASSKSDVTTTVVEVPPLPELPTNPVKHCRNDSGISLSPPTASPPLPHRATPPATPPQRRRQDKVTPSMYTMASASTRLGEIPELKWSLPYDYDAMTRSNQEHGGRPWPPPLEPMRPRRGFLSLFKKSDYKTAEVGA